MEERDEAVSAQERAIDEESGTTAAENAAIEDPAGRAEADAAAAEDLRDAAIDRKYVFVAQNIITGIQHTSDEGIVFLAKDNALVPTLKLYQDECKRLGAAEEQIKSIGLLIMRVEKWREQNPDKCKVADVTAEEAKELLKPNS